MIVRARVDAGVRIRLPDGLTLNGEGFYDGLGAKDYKSYGGSIRLNIPLQRDAGAAEALKLGVQGDAAAGDHGRMQSHRSLSSRRAPTTNGQAAASR